MEHIEELLVSGGYFRARISTLSPFDKITGGLAWCISASNVDVDYDHLDYSDDLILGEKIQIGEAIESALKRMECPHPLQAHQIQGLDYPAVLPVVQWLVNRVLRGRDQIGDRIRRYSHFQFSKNYELPSTHESKDQQDSIRGRAHSGYLQRIYRQSRNLPLYFDRNVRVEYTVLEYGSESAQSQALAKHLDASQAKSAEGIDNESYDQQIDVLRSKIAINKERLSFLTSRSQTDRRASIEGQVGRRAGVLQSELSKLRIASESEATIDQIIRTLRATMVLETENAIFLEACKSEQEKMIKRLHDVKDQLLPTPRNLSEKKSSLRKELARLSRAVVVLQRRLDDVPVQSELMQYERCFMELYVNIQAKLRETRKYFASYNALVEANDLSNKEISLLNSINSQYKMAMATPEGREKFADSMQGISQGAQQKLQKMEERYSERKRTFDLLKAKHTVAIANKRQYYALLKQLQEEFARNEKLKTS